MRAINSPLERMFLSLTFLVLSLWSTESVGQSDIDTISAIKREIQLSKTSFLVREPIWILISYTNVSQEPQKTRGVDVDNLVVIDSFGNRYQTPVCSYNLGFLTLAPNETSSYEFNILQYYGIEESKFKIRFYLPAEHYTVYDVQGKYKSNILEFDVINPEGDELKAMRLLKEGYDLHIEKKGEEAVKKFREIVEGYPHSFYAPMALDTEITTYRYSLDDNDTALERCYELIEKYPTSGSASKHVAGVALYYIYKNPVTGKTDALEAMHDLIRKYPETSISRAAKKMLQEMEEKDF